MAIKRNERLKNIHRNIMTYGDPQKLRLHANESDQVFDISVWADFVYRMLKESNARLYPEISSGIKSISSIFDIDEKHINLYDGCDRAIRNVFQVFTEPGCSVLTFEYDFPLYMMYAELYDVNLTTITFDDDTLPVYKLINSINDNVRMVILSNPNYPLGKSMKYSELKLLLDTCEDNGVLLVIDETYIEFAENTKTLIEESCNTDNLIVLRSMSKGYASAGVRIGFSVSTEENNSWLRKVNSLNDISGFSVQWLKLIVRHLDYFKSLSFLVKKRRKELIEFLEEHNVEYIETDSNFINIKNRLEHEYIITKQADYSWSDKPYTRLTIPGDDENLDFLLKAIKMNL